jgi:hypothetical protein
VQRVIGALLGGLVLWALVDKRPKVNGEIQGLFERFNETIKLNENDERRKLRAKREVLLSALNRKLNAASLSFESFDQGSYAMQTGVVPKDGNYDIDIGLIFDCSLERFPDPVALKCIVREALSGSNRTVDIRRSCVTVTYMRKDEVDYHVDLALYLKLGDGRLLLAKGRECSGPKHRKWAPSAPQELTQYVRNRFAGEDQAQFRRCVRYLKRWRDENFSGGAPLSIALTMAAAYWFEPRRTEDGTYVDIEALHDLVKKIRNNFGNGWVPGRLVVRLPGAVRADLMGRMTDIQMREFRERLKDFQQALGQCFGDPQNGDLNSILGSQFGSDFPALDEPAIKPGIQKKRMRSI